MTFPRSHTQTSLATARRCLRLYYLKYILLLERIGDEREVLLVGTCWHRAHEIAARGGDPYAVIAAHAPSAKWAVKLARLYATWCWYWKSQPIEVVEPEQSFRLEILGHVFEGKMDGKVRVEGRRGILELKTSGEDVGEDASYWDRLKMDPQVGLYGVAADRPEFILYDVVRKPGTNPKAITKADIARMHRELKTKGAAAYFAETFTGEQLAEAFARNAEDLALYGARLTADIGDRPEWYFQRRNVPRTDADYDALLLELDQQVQLLDFAESRDLYPVNPNACTEFGLCEFFHLCSNHRRPGRDEAPPQGFQRRQHVHPELVQPTNPTTP